MLNEREMKADPLILGAGKADSNPNKCMFIGPGEAFVTYNHVLLAEVAETDSHTNYC